jgi:SAM-dependent methyltransferase
LKPLLELKDNALWLPDELCEAIGRPRRLRLEEPADGSFARIRPTTIADMTYRRARAAARSALGRPRFVRAQTLARGRVGPNATEYRLARPVMWPNIRFGASNQSPSIDLVPYRGATEQESLALLWPQITDLDDEGPVAQARTEWLVDAILEPLDPRSILEIGCGGGRNLAALAQAFPGATLHGFDPSPNAVARAKASLQGTAATVEEGTNESVLPLLASGSFDVVLSFGVLMMVPEEAARSTLRELHRIARRAVVLFEKSGPSRSFDFWTYPRDYQALIRELGLMGETEHITFPPGHPLGGNSLPHTVSVVRIPA